ncbi:MAG TPA: 4-hydroxy-tetrahydrodipicolinate synthase [Dehalococcoidia bacterium]|nr:4-hydroxy-tetrahydrodipicolinate synthase [Dehalococcoidia bacterium]
MEIGRLLTAMVTPFDEEGRVDYQQAQRLALALLDSGSDGVVVTGSTGEAPTLSHEEKVRLWAEVKRAVGQRGAVVAGASTYDTAESCELAREAEKVGADGLLLTVPYYNKPSQEGLFRHFQAIAASTSLPCIPYNVPGRTSVNMAAETTLRLAQIDNIIGVKEASGDLVQVGRIIAGAQPGFRVWSGDDQLTLPILAIGGYGVVCVVSHLAGRQMQEMIQAHLAGRVQEAAAIHQRLLPLMNVLMTASTNPTPVKHALNRVGFRVGKPRLPLVEPEGAAAELIVDTLRQQQIDLPVTV